MLEFFKNNGIKLTSQRKKILNAIKSSVNKHFSAEELYNLLSSDSKIVSLATIYRFLSLLELAGVLTKHNFKNHCAIFELLVSKEHHDHLICNKCKRFIEFLDPLIEKRQQEIANKYNFTILGHSLSIFGMCNTCVSTNNK